MRADSSWLDLLRGQLRSARNWGFAHTLVLAVPGLPHPPVDLAIQIPREPSCARSSRLWRRWRARRPQEESRQLWKLRKEFVEQGVGGVGEVGRRTSSLS